MTGLGFHRRDVAASVPVAGQRLSPDTPSASQQTGASGESAGPSLPLAGLRVLDMTAWWAGPAACHLLACFGAEVIHVESTVRPDGLRMLGG